MLISLRTISYDSGSRLRSTFCSNAVPSIANAGAATDPRCQHQILLHTECEVQLPSVEHVDDHQAHGDAERRAEQSEQQAFAEKERQDARGPRADRSDGADLADALVHGHHHHVHHTHQHDRDQHDLDEHGHQVDHPRQVRERRQVGPGVHLEHRLAFGVGHAVQHLRQPGIDGVELAGILQPDRNLADLGLLHAQQFARVVDVDVAVAPAGPGDALQHAPHDEGLAVHRAVAIGCNQHHGVCDLGLHAARQQQRDDDLALGHQRAVLAALDDAAGQQRHRGRFARRIDAVDANGRGLDEVAVHAAELHARRPGLHGVDLLQRLLDLGHGLRPKVEVQRQVVDRGDVALAVHLQVAKHGVGDLAHHRGLERARHRNEQQHRDHADHDQQQRQQRAAPVARQVAPGDPEHVKHGRPPCGWYGRRPGRLPA
jgi:hypothetical protein